jgi:hypothetical protein
MKSYLVLLASSLLLFAGCFGPEEEIPNYQNVHGAVVTSSGEPLLDVNVHVRNHFGNVGFIENEPYQENYALQFISNTRDLYTANLFRYGMSDPLITFFEDTLSVGDQRLEVADSLLTNGIYGYEVLNSVNLATSGLFLVNKPDNLLPNTLAFTNTRANGEFTLNSAYLALGRPFDTSNGGGFEITDSLIIIITDNEKILKKEYVHVLPEQSNFFEIVVDEADL